MINKSKYKPLKPPGKNSSGLVIWCGHCKRQIGGALCKGNDRQNNRPLSSCEHLDKHQYKVVVRLRGDKKKKKTKNLETRNLEDARIQASVIKKGIKGNLIQPASKVIPIREQISEHPLLLKDSLAEFTSFLNDANLPERRRKNRSKEYLKDIDRALEFLMQTLVNKGYNRETITVGDINDQVVEDIYSALYDKNFSGRTVNKYISTYFSFMKHYNKYHFSVINYFSHSAREQLTSNPEVITTEEFEALLAIVNPENDQRFYSMVRKKDGKRRMISRRVYRPWLVDAFRLFAETGRRREEVVKLRWNDIDEKEETITAEDYKSNRIKKRFGNNKRYIYIPITPTLKSLLKTLGYDQYKGTDKYILAPEIDTSRGRVISDIVTRAFSHYYAQLNTGKSITLKSLRKTYITELYKKIGPAARLITGHSSDAIMEGSYVDKRAISSRVSFEGVYPQSQRENELKDIRETNVNPQTKQPEI